ncbi:MAG: hypothetical protein KBC96_04740 [Armatimonadetes bacterium]|nr:hypothetical protein [Armatimonadota bacterium]
MTLIQRLRRLEELAEEQSPYLYTKDGGKFRVSSMDLLGAFVELLELEALRTLDRPAPEKPPEYGYLWPALCRSVEGQSGLVDMLRTMALEAVECDERR